MTVTVESGRPFPLGSHYDGGGVNFAVFSANATAIDLCLYAPLTGHEYARVRLPECTDEVFHGYVPGLSPGTAYGFRAYGPYDPERGHRFNPNKLLIDPYAKVLTGRIRCAEVMSGYRPITRDDLSFDERDSASAVPKALVTVDDWGVFKHDRLRRHWADTIIYEAHTRGLTMRMDGVSPGIAGTYEALGSKPVLDHLTKLGITAIELLPVQAFMDESFLAHKGLTNYWGYSPICYFAPEPRYDQGSRGEGVIERFRAMVDRLHGAGIEVILDVVYNHTGEVDQFGPTLSFRGLDNASYYRLNPDRPRWYINDTGTGNTLNAGHPRVVQLILDSLRHWTTVMGVDGFRFDLASTVGREPHGFDPDGRFLTALRQDPTLASVKLIAEPWDIGPGGYQLGHFPPGVSEWNDRFRDCVRGFWRGDEQVSPELAARLLGSADFFNHRGRRPRSSVNFVTAHDGFTLADLVSFENKHNEANLEDNRDGHSDNHSANYGAEGPTEDSEILAIRRRQRRNILATTLLSQGTPMVLAGDEVGNSQSGNNNAYCQDNEVGWVDWQAGDDPEFETFAGRLIAFRKSHPVLRQTRFLHSRVRAQDGLHDVEWIAQNGRAMRPEDWNSRESKCFGVVVRGSALSHLEDDGESLLIVMNAHRNGRRFVFPSAAERCSWKPVLTTETPDGLPMATNARLAGQSIDLPGRVLMVFAEAGPKAAG